MPHLYNAGMNLNKSLYILCGTAVLICLLFLLKPLIPSAPERTTSNERVLTQPERNTSHERVETNRIAATERLVDKQLATAETIRSNELYFQTQQKLSAETQRSNYFAAKAELTTAWVEKSKELKAARASQGDILLANMELRAKIAAKYNVSLDSEPDAAIAVAPPIVVVQPSPVPPTPPPRTRESPRTVEDGFSERYGIRRTKVPQTPTTPNASVLATMKAKNASANTSQVASMKAQAMAMARKMWAIEAAGGCYQHFPLPGMPTGHLNPTTRHWERVPDSEYDPTYDNIRLPLDKLRIEIQKYDPTFN